MRKVFALVFVVSALSFSGICAAATHQISGTLKDYYNNPVEANVVLYQEGTINIVDSVQTSNGNYDLTADGGTYDLEYNIQGFSISGFLIKLRSLETNSDFQNIIAQVTDYQSENKISFTVDNSIGAGSQIVQTYSPQKPKNVIVNGAEGLEVGSIANLVDGAWYYNPNTDVLNIQYENTIDEANVFRETCDTWNPALWTWMWDQPEVVDGTWVFSFPPGKSDNIQAVLRQYTDYGTYSMRFRVDGPRRPINGMAWYGMFIFGESLNEIDFVELMGGHQSYVMSVSVHPYDANGQKIINPNEPEGKWYWYWDSEIDFEDGAWHTWEATYTPDQIIIKTDGVTQQVINNKQEWNNNIDFFPQVGDLRLMIGGGFDGSQAQTWKLIVDEITFQPMQSGAQTAIPIPDDEYCYHSALATYSGISPSSAEESRQDINRFTSLVQKDIYMYSMAWGLAWEESLWMLYGSGDQRSLIEDGTVEALQISIWPVERGNALDDWTIREIANGLHDNYIRTIARQARDFQYPLQIRFGGEFNINQGAVDYQYSFAKNPTDFVNAWRRVYDIFEEEGAMNVDFVWCANCVDIGPHHWTEYYPGDGYVDWVGIDLYQFEVNSNPDSLMSGVYNDYSARKPIQISEWGVNWYNAPYSDASRWTFINNFFNAVEARPKIKMINYWYNPPHTFDIVDYPLATSAYRTRISNARYITTNLKYDSILGVYHFQSESTSSTVLRNGADLAKSTGFNIIRIGLGPKSYYNQGGFDTNFDLPTAATNSDYAYVFSKFDTIAITAYDGASWPLEYSKMYLDKDFMSNPTNIQNIQDEYYDLAKYLYTTYNGQGKTFVLLNWESDNDIYCGQSYNYALYQGTRDWCDGLYSGGSYGSSQSPADSIGAMKKWMTARQNGIDLAKTWANGQGITGVEVLNGVEFNIVHALYDNGFQSILYDLSASADLDYNAYSSYESINKADPYAELLNDISLIGSITNSNNIIVGEYAYPDSDQSKLNIVINAIRDSDADYGFYWQLIDTTGYSSGLYDANLNSKPLQSFFENKLDQTI